MATKARYVVVRDNKAGVYAGTLLKSKTPGVTVLKNVRHIWQWTDRLSVSDIASRGVGNGSKVATMAPRIELREVVSVSDCTAAAKASIESIVPWNR
jgi:hypothetical protein